MEREKVAAAFKAYTDNYDTGDVRIALKIRHTYRVAGIAERIAASIGLSADERDFAWLLGLLHDIGRFEQLTRYGTFIDKDSVDHAELGADILFKDGLIKEFVGESGFDEWRKKAETAIRLHNKLFLPEDLDEGTQSCTDLLRDADKIDIMRVLTEPPYDERNRRVTESSREIPAVPARQGVMDCVMEHRCVPRTFERTEFESLISSCCMCFELAYDESRKIVCEQGYLDKLMNVEVLDETMARQLGILRDEMKKAWGI